MRRVLTGLVALAVCFTAGTMPAAGDPASSSSASAFGLAATGLLPISPTITASASQPPDEDVVSPPTLLTVPLGGLALSGTIGVDAHAHQADDLQPVLGTIDATETSNPTELTNVNAQSLAKTEGLAVLFNDPGGDPAGTAIRTLLAQLSDVAGGLVAADAVVAEAVAKCVNNQPVFEVGYTVAELGGLVGRLLDPVVQPVLALLLQLLGEDAPLSAIISVEAGRVTPLSDGVAVDGLVVRIPLLDQEIIVSHAEAHMPGNCAVTPPEPTGPGDIAPKGDAPRRTLATTGSDFPYLPLAAVMLGAAYALRRITRPRPQA